MPPYRRNIFLINKKFQFRFAFYVCSWLVALSFVYPLIVHSLFEYFVRYAMLDPTGPSIDSLQGTRKEILTLLVALQVIFLVVTFLISIFMSHRIAGPLHKLSRFFADARDGKLEQKLFFREKDHFQDSFPCRAPHRFRNFCGKKAACRCADNRGRNKGD